MAEQYIKHSDLVSFAADNVNIPQDKLKVYREQVARLKEKLEAHIKDHPDYDLVKVLHSGSVAKGTALKTLNDMDLAVYVKKTEENPDEEKLLEWLIARLKDAYKNILKPEQFSPGTHCVKISFRGTGLDIDVSPIIYEENEEDKGYLINKDTGNRVLTSIPLHLKFLQERKNKLPNHFRQSIRLLKWWNREQKKLDTNFRFKSFMVELICSHLLDKQIDMSDYSIAMEEFFLYIVKSGLKERIYFTDNYNANKLPGTRRDIIEIFDPVNPENNVASMYTEIERLKIVNAAHSALDAIYEAKFSTTKSRAVERWQEVLGSSFNL